MPEPGAGTTLPPLREVIARFGIGARRSLGQHFLFDLNLTRRIARAAGDLSGSTVVEIGPGPGGLTRALLEAGARRVIAIERDARCLAALAELAAAFPGRLEVIEGDALEIDAALAGGADAPRRIVANLPYNIATALLLRWLRRADAFCGMTLMFQKEVAERITAKRGSDAYGRLAVISQWLCEARIAFDVPARAFVPPPGVTSSVICLTPRDRPLADADMTALETVTRAAFGQRRKMLRSALKPLGRDAGLLIETAGVSPTARAEELTIEQFCALARALAERRSTPPAPPG